MRLFGGITAFPGGCNEQNIQLRATETAACNMRGAIGHVNFKDNVARGGIDPTHPTCLDAIPPRRRPDVAIGIHTQDPPGTAPLSSSVYTFFLLDSRDDV